MPSTLPRKVLCFAKSYKIQDRPSNTNVVTRSPCLERMGPTHPRDSQTRHHRSGSTRTKASIPDVGPLLSFSTTVAAVHAGALVRAIFDNFLGLLTRVSTARDPPRNLPRKVPSPFRGRTWRSSGSCRRLRWQRAGSRLAARAAYGQRSPYARSDAFGGAPQVPPPCRRRIQPRRRPANGRARSPTPPRLSDYPQMLR